jgi:hypothetical protein
MKYYKFYQVNFSYGSSISSSIGFLI